MDLYGSLLCSVQEEVLPHESHEAEVPHPDPDTVPLQDVLQCQRRREHTGYFPRWLFIVGDCSSSCPRQGKNTSFITVFFFLEFIIASCHSCTTTQNWGDGPSDQLHDQSSPRSKWEKSLQDGPDRANESKQSRQVPECPSKDKASHISH